MRHTHSPLTGLWHREDPEAGEPLPGATSQNWLATGTFAIAGVLAALTVPAHHLISIFAAAYGVGLAATAWMVRPRRGRRPAYTLLMALILLQAAVYALYWYPIAAYSFTGEKPPEPTTAQLALAQVALAAFMTGWAPSLFLYLFARQGRPLLLVQTVAPAAGLVMYVLSYLVP